MIGKTYINGNDRHPFVNSHRRIAQCDPLFFPVKIRQFFTLNLRTITDFVEQERNYYAYML